MSSSRAFVPEVALAARARFQPVPLVPSAAAAADGVGPKATPVGPRDAVRDEAYERGFREGLAKGREEGAEAARAALPIEDAELLRSAAASFAEAARGVAALRRGYWVENRKTVVELALCVAERLLRRELSTDPDALAGVVERALEALGEVPALRLRLSVVDAEALSDGRAPGLAELSRRHGIEVEADPRLVPGDARVLSERTAVDARLAESLRRIGEELSELAERTPVEAPEDAPSEDADSSPGSGEGEVGCAT